MVEVLGTVEGGGVDDVEGAGGEGWRRCVDNGSAAWWRCLVLLRVEVWMMKKVLVLEEAYVDGGGEAIGVSGSVGAGWISWGEVMVVQRGRQPLLV